MTTELSGVNLARQSLVAARETARKNGTTNEKVPGGLVRALHVLAPAAMKAGPAPAAADPAPQPATPAVPVERRSPPQGYHQAIKAHRQAALRSRVDPHITVAVERQTRSMRELSRRAFPETEVAVDDVPAPINAAHLQRRREAAAIEAAALRRARAERAARQAGTAALVPNAPVPLRTTA
ncbi:hypothetical protein ACFWSF_24140 [Streptomyces sp. NPDC058611]|uniref:hypothetical protein n=1 Tax=unclassified Streptomyces TaxID=2593676 RepID=UPI003649CC05